MGTTIYESEDNKISVTRYWGGAERRLCYQIRNDKLDYSMILTRNEIAKILPCLVKDILEDWEDMDTARDGD